MKLNLCALSQVHGELEERHRKIERKKRKRETKEEKIKIAFIQIGYNFPLRHKIVCRLTQSTWFGYRTANLWLDLNGLHGQKQGKADDISHCFVYLGQGDNAPFYRMSLREIEKQFLIMDHFVRD